MGRRLRIAIYGERFPPAGGGGISAAHWQLYHLLRNSHNVRLFAFVDGSPEESSEVVYRRGSRLLGALIEFCLVRYIRRYDRGRIDCCRKIAETIPAVRAMSRDLHQFDPDVVILSDDRLPALGLRPPKRSKLVWVAHHNYQRFRNQWFLNTSCDYDMFLAHRLERRAVRKCDHAVFVSEYMERVFRETLECEMPGKVIPNYFPVSERPSEADRSRTRSEMGVGASDCVVFIPSGGTPVKGARFVPEIIRRLRATNGNSIRFCITGPIAAPLEAELQSYAELQNSETTVFRPGPVSHEMNLRYVAASDVCVSPTLLENYSCALLECQALGVPCVTFDVGGNNEVIDDGVTGYVVPHLDVDRLCESASRLLQDEQLKDRMSAACISRAQDLACPEDILARYNEVFDELVETR